MMGVRESVAREIKYVTTITLFTVIVYIYSDAETRGTYTILYLPCHFSVRYPIIPTLFTREYVAAAVKV
jgi:hypothetical protein